MTSRCRHGFTLLEILVALALVALVLAAASTRFDRLFATTRLSASARGIGDHVAYAIGRSYTAGSYHTLQFDLETGSYWIEVGRAEEAGEPILKRRLGKGVTFTDIEAAGETYLPPGTLSIEVSPLGITNDIIVNLEDERGAAAGLHVNALVQGITYFEEHATLEEYEDAREP